VILNKTDDMTMKWWSSERFNKHFDYLQPNSIHVYPLHANVLSDTELMQSMGIYKNRHELYLKETRDQNAKLRLEQDQAYHQSLMHDMEKQKCDESVAAIVEPLCNDQVEDDGNIDPSSDEPKETIESDDEYHLNVDALRAARLRYFAQHT
jgi:hypothetical protein